MQRSRIRVFIASILSLAVAVSASLPALAEEPNPNENQIHIDEGIVTVYDAESNDFVQNDELTQNPVLEGDLSPEDPADYEGWIYPALDVDNEENDVAFTVDGSVEMEVNTSGTATAVMVETSGAETNIMIQGDAIAQADAQTPNQETGEESAIAFAVVGRALPAGDVEITVEGDATAIADGHEGTGWSTAVYADASFNNASTAIHVEGDATAEAAAGKESEEQDETLTHAVSAVAENTGSVTVTVDGKASASSEETSYVAQAVYANATSDPEFDHEGTKTEVTIGEGAEGQVMALSDNEGTTKVAIQEGGVHSDSGRYGAVVGDADSGGTTEINITGDIVSSDSELHPGIAIGAALSAADEGTTEATITGNITAEAAHAAEEEGLYALGLDTDSDGGTVKVQVEGDVQAVTSSEGDPRADTAGISALALSENGQAGSVTVEVNGDVKAGAHNTDGVAEALGITASAEGADNEVSVHVQGDVIAESTSTEADVTQQFGTRAIYADAENGGSVQVVVDGKAAAEAPEDLAMPRSVDAEAYGKDSEVTIQIGEGAEGTITATSNQSSMITVTVAAGGVEAGMLGVGASANDESITQILVQGDIEVHETEIDPGESYGISLTADEEGAAAVMVTGNVTATGETGYAVGLSAENAGGSVEASIVGDLSASGAENNYGIEIYTAEETHTDILVDGTVRGEDAAVVLVQPETQIGENVTLTVWELVPDDNGATVSRKENASDTELKEDEAAEAAVQYIIRVKAEQHDIIDTRGTEEYKGYDVAHEGDTVTLLVNVPDGYEITGAYGDVDQSVVLTKDENGNYFLTVPRGGAVELSVKLEKIENEGIFPDDNKKTNPSNQSGKAVISVTPENTDEDDSEPEDEGANSVYRFLKIADKTGKAEIAFFSNGLYFVKYEDGTAESGKFTVMGETIVLINNNDTNQTQMIMELNQETDLYELAYHPSADPGKTYEFEVSHKAVLPLVALQTRNRAS